MKVSTPPDHDFPGCCLSCRGYTRKEPFANTFGGLPWIPLAENWNGRLAMVGFALMLFSEGVLKMNTLQAWGLQSLHFGP